jgi:hypothetical protein
MSNNLSSAGWNLIHEASLQLGARLQPGLSICVVVHDDCSFEVSSLGIAPHDSLLLRVDLAELDVQRDAQRVLVGMLLNKNLCQMVGLPAWYAADHEREKFCVFCCFSIQGAAPSDLARALDTLASTLRGLAAHASVA